MTGISVPQRSESKVQRLVRRMGARAFYDSLTDEQRARLPFEWAAWRRKEQETPPGAWETWFVLAGRGFGKALALDTPVPTPSGWTTIGEISVGDAVFDELGRVCLVMFATEVQLGRPCNEVEFSDGSVIVADDDHRWLTDTKASRKARGRATKPLALAAVRTTREIRETLRVRREVNHSIRTCGALSLPAAELPIDPYVFGVWLGDGDSAGAMLTQGGEDAAEIRRLVEERGVVCGIAKRDQRGRASTERFWIGTQPPTRGRDGRMQANGSFHSKLRALGVIRNKHVPVAFLRASANQRRDLLAGLMDTDGHCTTAGHVEFCTTRETLRDAVVELAASLGFKPTSYAERARLEGVDVGPRWRVRWTPHEPVFRLPRKLARQHSGKKQRERSTTRYVVDVRAVASVPVRCLTVDSPSHLFLVGRAMIPTHNTKTGAEVVREEVESGRAGRVGLVGRTAADVRDVMVEGESGIRACSPPEWRPKYEPSKRRVVWPNGATATMYAADRPDQLRGPQHDLVWSDEFAAWRYQEESLSNIELLLRLGSNPRHVITTTPRPTRKVRDLLKGSRNVALACQVCRAPAWTACTIHEQPVVVTRGSTFDNAGNLVAKFFAKLRRLYEGTRLGRQELFAEVLDDLEGALWNYGLLERYRRKSNEVPPMLRIVVAVDPAESDEDYSNEHGIVIAGRGKDDRGYVLADRSGKMSPLEWAMTAVRAYYEFSADAIVIEDNTGGAAAVANVRLVDQNCRIILVTATTGKRTRAEPVASIYEQGRASHAGLFAELEDQMTDWTPIRTSSSMSPDRVDALVWAFYELFDLASSPFAFA